MKKILFSLLFSMTLCLHAQTWRVEAEDATSTVVWKDGTATIVAPKGLTLWCEEKMEGNVVIEYEARIVGDKRFKDEQGNVRVSDMNCFWMADKCGGYGGRFVDNYALQTYYVGYGGNWNNTTRFRRYSGDLRGIDSMQHRPPVLKEYTDKEHLLTKDRWYKIRLEQVDGHARYYIDGELLVDYVDPKPLTEGFFAFRTTMAKAQLRKFRYTCDKPDEKPVVLKWVGNQGMGAVTFGVPFSLGEVTKEEFKLKTDKGLVLPFDTWRLASWQDGSVKWQAFTTIVPEGTDSVLLTKEPFHPLTMTPPYRQEDFPPFYVTLNGKQCPILTHEIEAKGNFRKVHKYMGQNFIIRAYQFAGCKEMKLVHTLLVDSVLNKEGLHELSIHFKVPLHGEKYERFADFDGKRMSVQPLLARRIIDLNSMDNTTQSMLRNIAQWDDFRLSQLSPSGYSIRKRATHKSPWIGTIEGQRSEGMITVGDSTSQMSFRLKDFWQSYPSTLLVSGMRSDTAIVTISLYSPEAEPYSFEHYDTIPHTLEAAYEDVQPGMSTAWGIGRTSTIWIGNQLSTLNCQLSIADSQLTPTPEYLHRKRAFGIWSLPTLDTPRDSLIESTLGGIMQFYEKEIERNGWYGFFNYGDVMHAYDASRDEWRYDVGGYAWDNTELGTPAMFWYQFLRTGDPNVWRMAEAMTRHCSEVDTYHTGPHAGLGSRHNVTHWGCGAKEARISEAWWNRFYYYLTADDRIGNIMHEVVDADTLLYILDPMRLAQPRELYPCTAPARLRIGPDWLAYASNWLTEWERHGKAAQKYAEKLKTGIADLKKAPLQLISGNNFEYDPESGHLGYIGENTAGGTHLAICMGGPQTWFELVPLLGDDEWQKMLADFGTFYFASKEEQQERSHGLIGNREFSLPFMAATMGAYGANYYKNSGLAKKVWEVLLRAPADNGSTAQNGDDFKIKKVSFCTSGKPIDEIDWVTTNVTAQFCLNAIVCLELIGDEL